MTGPVFARLEASEARRPDRDESTDKMTTLIYKRTHTGDPDPVTGVFGCDGCMGCIRGWRFDNVIGIGGIGERVEHGLKGKLTWIGLGAQKNDSSKAPRLTFDHFLYLGDSGKLLRNIAPHLAVRVYDRNTRATTDFSFLPEERAEIARILDMARASGPSPKCLDGKTTATMQGKCKRRDKSRTIRCSTTTCPRRAS